MKTQEAKLLQYTLLYDRSGKLVTEKIEETSGTIEFSLNDEYIFYSKLDKHHRPRTIYRHKIGTPVKNDILIFEGSTYHRVLPQEKDIERLSLAFNTVKR